MTSFVLLNLVWVQSNQSALGRLLLFEISYLQQMLVRSSISVLL